MRLRLPDGTVVPLSPQPQPLEVPAAVRAFERDTTRLRTPVVRDRYVGSSADARSVRIRAWSRPDPRRRYSALARCRVRVPSTAARCRRLRRAGAPDSPWAVVEAIVGRRHGAARWPLQVALLDTLPVVAELDDDTARHGYHRQHDGRPRRCRAAPTPGSFPTGTRATVTGRRNDDLRLRLSPDAEAWVPVGDARPLPAGGARAAAVVGSVSADAELRIGPPCGSR